MLEAGQFKGNGLQHIGGHTFEKASKTKELIEKSARMALASIVLGAAVLSGAPKGIDTAYAAQGDGVDQEVAPIVSVLRADTDRSSAAGAVGEGMAAQIAKMNSEALSAMPTREDALLDLAIAQLGVPYVFGGTTPSGFDCSGFTQYVFKEALDIELPRTADAQYAMGEAVSLNELQAGDLVFWGSGKGIYHVGIYIGDGQYIHAGNRSRSICIQSMSAYSPSCAKRII